MARELVSFENKMRKLINNHLMNYNEHDIDYENSNSLVNKHNADKILEIQNWEIFKSKNSGL